MTQQLKEKVQEYIWYFDRHGDNPNIQILIKEDMIKLLREINEENQPNKCVQCDKGFTDVDDDKYCPKCLNELVG